MKKGPGKSSKRLPSPFWRRGYPYGLGGRFLCLLQAHSSKNYGITKVDVMILFSNIRSSPSVPTMDSLPLPMYRTNY